MNQPIWLTPGAPEYGPDARDIFVGHRQERWEWRALALDHAEIGTLDGIGTASIEYSTGNTIRGGGSTTWIGEPESEPDWHRIYLQPWYYLRAPDGREISWPRGVYIPAAVPIAYGDGTRTISIELYDKLLILDQDIFGETYTVDKGQNVVGAIRAVIEGAGQTLHNIEESSETTKNPMIWEPGTSRLRIVNDLLDSINYFALWADGHGVYQGLPYREPSARPTARAFIDDENSIYAPEFTHDRDTFSIPNRVVAVGRGDGEDETFIGIAENRDPASPTSYPARGRWITHREDDVDATSQAVIDALVQRRLNELSQSSSVVEFEHAMIPMELNDIIEFQYANDLRIRAAIQSFSISTGIGELVSTRVREVAG